MACGAEPVERLAAIRGSVLRGVEADDVVDDLRVRAGVDGALGIHVLAGAVAAEPCGGERDFRSRAGQGVRESDCGPGDDGVDAGFDCRELRGGGDREEPGLSTGDQQHVPVLFFDRDGARKHRKTINHGTRR